MGATLDTLLKFLNWIPLGYIFETKLIQTLIFKASTGTAQRLWQMQNISRGPTFRDFVTIRTERSMQDVTVSCKTVQSTGVQTPPSSRCNVLRESRSVDFENIPCATLKRRGVVSNFYLCANVCLITHCLLCLCLVPDGADVSECFYEMFDGNCRCHRHPLRRQIHR